MEIARKYRAKRSFRTALDALDFADKVKGGGSPTQRAAARKKLMEARAGLDVALLPPERLAQGNYSNARTEAVMRRLQDAQDQLEEGH